MFYSREIIYIWKNKAENGREKSVAVEPFTRTRFMHKKMALKAKTEKRNHHKFMAGSKIDEVVKFHRLNFGMGIQKNNEVCSKYLIASSCCSIASSDTSAHKIYVWRKCFFVLEMKKAQFVTAFARKLQRSFHGRKITSYQIALRMGWLTRSHTYICSSGVALQLIEAFISEMKIPYIFT